MPNLFSYGTLQNKKVQIETFGRILKGEKDTLVGYIIKMIEISSLEVLRKSNQKFHPIIEYSANIADRVDGVLFEVTEQEILNADEYELEDYKRIEVEFQSKKIGFIYVRK